MHHLEQIISPPELSQAEIVPNLLEQSVLALFKMLNTQEINYILLRNYEQFPRFGHDIDLVVAQKDLPQFKKVLKTLGKTFGWTHVTECLHWQQSPASAHHIQVFRFYQFTKNDPVFMPVLQVDCFHSYLLMGIPLFDETMLLEHKIFDETLEVYRVSPVMETLFRLFQIQGIWQKNDCDPDDQHAKLSRYQERILSNLTPVLIEEIEQLTQKSGLASFNLQLALNLLQQDFSAYCKYISQTKLNYLFFKLFQSPIKTTVLLFCRLIDVYLHTLINPCGPKIKINTTIQNMLALKEQLQDLKQKNWIASTYFEQSINLLPRNFYRACLTRSRGGIVLQTYDSSCCSDFSTASQDIEPATIQLHILEKLIGRHPDLLTEDLPGGSLCSLLF